MIILGDFTTSVERALSEIAPDYEDLYGLVLCGTHAPTQEKLDDMLKELDYAFISKLPTLGICFGMQAMVIRYCRDRGIASANTEELDPYNAVVTKLPNLRVGIKMTPHWHGNFYESHWHRYAASPEAINILRENDEFFLYKTMENQTIILEAMKHKLHPFYAGIQAHPEYQSSKQQPHKILVEFINKCREMTVAST